MNLSFTPSFTYTRADCPRYGALVGPSCFTAPEVPVRADLPEVLLPQNYQPPPDLAPPPGTAIGENGNLVAVPGGAAPASFGGNVGPVGSGQERDRLGELVGEPATVATQLLLGPVARGTVVTRTPLPAPEPKP